MICGDQNCGCAIESATLDVSGSGTPADPWVIEQIEFTNLTTIENDIAAILAVLENLPSDYVNVTGDLMTGRLNLTTSSSQMTLRRTDDERPYFEFVRNADGTSIGYLMADAVDNLVKLAARASIGIAFYTNNTEVARIDTSGNLLVAKTATGIATTGAEVQADGEVTATRATTGQNFRSNKTSTANADGQIHFDVLSAGTTIGSITRATATTTGFNTTSDEEWKQLIREIDDELALYWLRIVQPMLFEYVAVPGVTYGGYIAQRVAAAWPESITLGIVTPGWGSIDDRTWDDDGNETTSHEVYRPWQIDLSKFVPFIHAGLQAVDVRVSVLEDLVAAHTVAIAELKAELDETTDALVARLEALEALP